MCADPNIPPDEYANLTRRRKSLQIDLEESIDDVETIRVLVKYDEEFAELEQRKILLIAEAELIELENESTSVQPAIANWPSIARSNIVPAVDPITAESMSSSSATTTTTTARSKPLFPTVHFARVHTHSFCCTSAPMSTTHTIAAPPPNSPVCTIAHHTTTPFVLIGSIQNPPTHAKNYWTATQSTPVSPSSVSSFDTTAPPPKSVPAERDTTMPLVSLASWSPELNPPPPIVSMPYTITTAAPPPNISAHHATKPIAVESGSFPNLPPLARSYWTSPASTPFVSKPYTTTNIYASHTTTPPVFATSGSTPIPPTQNHWTAPQSMLPPSTPNTCPDAAPPPMSLYRSATPPQNIHSELNTTMPLVSIASWRITSPPPRAVSLPYTSEKPPSVSMLHTTPAPPNVPVVAPSELNSTKPPVLIESWSTASPPPPAVSVPYTPPAASPPPVFLPYLNAATPIKPAPHTATPSVSAKSERMPNSPTQNRWTAPQSTPPISL
ncbi:mucin-2-like [Folsomia candida]|uniref:mucin-2-like n=1 Tax=Folsomia candida TaxID=158441 RepID=UPI000B8F3EE3|nr:mucin-2-like [Folsomia candida]